MAWLGGPEDMELFRQALAVRLLPDPGPASWWRDRLGFLRSVLVTPVRIRFGAAQPLSSEDVAFDPSARREGMRARRSFFIWHYFGQRLDFVGRGQTRAPAGRGDGSTRGGVGWFRWYLVGVLAAVLSFLDFGERRYLWWSHVFADVQAFTRVLGGLRTVYCFGLFDRRPYVIAAFLARHTNIHVVLVYQNIPLYRNCRHLHLHVPVVLTSKVNLAEAEYFAKLGLFKASEITYKSQEFVLDLVDLVPSAPVFDIGYFSSGEWGRRDGLNQSEDVEAIRSGAFLDNEYAIMAEKILEDLVAYARERDLTLRIYPHPFERNLRTEHGIEPPYARLVDGRVVSVDESGLDSRRKIYEPKAAVSLQSSFIWERLDLGLDASFVYEWSDRERNPFLRAALGPYARQLFRDEAELRSKLDEVLSGSSA